MYRAGGALFTWGIVFHSSFYEHANVNLSSLDPAFIQTLMSVCFIDLIVLFTEGSEKK